ncbi:hypothetical protein PFISCL1PPCAC_16924, partial [Pristionchus fissidentatus]
MRWLSRDAKKKRILAKTNAQCASLEHQSHLITIMSALEKSASILRLSPTIFCNRRFESATELVPEISMQFAKANDGFLKTAVYCYGMDVNIPVRDGMNICAAGDAADVLFITGKDAFSRV